MKDLRFATTSVIIAACVMAAGCGQSQDNNDNSPADSVVDTVADVAADANATDLVTPDAPTDAARDQSGTDDGPFDITQPDAPADLALPDSEDIVIPDCGDSLDSDQDGVPDCADNCKNAHNPLQGNCDNDEMGDICDDDDDNDDDPDSTDCADCDPAVHHGATEICDSGIDNDCDGWRDVEMKITSPTVENQDYEAGATQELTIPIQFTIDGNMVAGMQILIDGQVVNYLSPQFVTSPVDVVVPYGQHRVTLALTDGLGFRLQDCSITNVEPHFDASFASISVRVKKACSMDDDCNDGNPCSSDICGTVGGAARIIPPLGICLYGSDAMNPGCCVSGYDCGTLVNNCIDIYPVEYPDGVKDCLRRCLYEGDDICYDDETCLDWVPTGHPDGFMECVPTILLPQD